MKLKVILGTGAAAAALFACGPAAAWGDDGHKLVALIAYGLLSDTARTTVDAMLASDHDKLTDTDFGSRATWADKYRDMNGRTLHYKGTKDWHFVDVELDTGDIGAPCHGFPALPPGTLASADDPGACAANKIPQFSKELGDKSTPPAERLMALKFLMHTVGDIHQPLHSSDDNGDGGANCEQVRTASKGPKFSLHHYWDTEVINAIVDEDQAEHPEDSDLGKVADRLRGGISAADKAKWQAGDVRAWVLETFAVSKAKAYHLPSHAACQAGDRAADYPAFSLSKGYQSDAADAATLQLQKAGVRLATVLNAALAKP